MLRYPVATCTYIVRRARVCMFRNGPPRARAAPAASVVVCLCVPLAVSEETPLSPPRRLHGPSACLTIDARPLHHLARPQLRNPAPRRTDGSVRMPGTAAVDCGTVPLAGRRLRAAWRGGRARHRRAPRPQRAALHAVRLLQANERRHSALAARRPHCHPSASGLSLVRRGLPAARAEPAQPEAALGRAAARAAAHAHQHAHTSCPGHRPCRRGRIGTVHTGDCAIARAAGPASPAPADARVGTAVRSAIHVATAALALDRHAFSTVAGTAALAASGSRRCRRHRIRRRSCRRADVALDKVAPRRGCCRADVAFRAANRWSVRRCRQPARGTAGRRRQPQGSTGGDHAHR